MITIPRSCFTIVFFFFFFPFFLVSLFFFSLTSPLSTSLSNFQLPTNFTTPRLLNFLRCVTTLNFLSLSFLAFYYYLRILSYSDFFHFIYSTLTGFFSLFFFFFFFLTFISIFLSIHGDFMLFYFKFSTSQLYLIFYELL
jgi:hypothetical protein